MLELRNISFKTDERDILKGINLIFELGKSYIVTGQPNSGKSLLMKILGGITKPTEGRVICNNVNLYTTGSTDTIRRHIGFIFSEGVMLANLSICENLFLPVKYLNPKHNKEEITAKIIDLFEVFHLPTSILCRRPADVSNTDKKLINIIRAILIEPEIFLIDMPLFNLDYGAQKRVINFLMNMKRSDKTMIITTTHRRIINSVADQVLLLVDGTIVATSAGKTFFTSANPIIRSFIENHFE